MSRCPVKPDTIVNIPQRAVVRKSPPVKKQLKPELIIPRLRKTIRRLWIAVAVLCVSLVLITSVLSLLLYHSYVTPDLGSNYNTIASEST